MGNSTARPTADRKHITVAICGNPNCGKTTIFNALTGLKQQVGNYPGVTVEKTTGRLTIPGDYGHDYSLIDIPGTYSLSAYSPDEYIAAKALFGGFGEDSRPDAVICVIDATNIERGLYLVFQVMQIGVPVIVALNMIDLAERQGVVIDTKRLSALLGVAVVPVVGSRGKGMAALKAAVAAATQSCRVSYPSQYHPYTEQTLDELIAECQNGHRPRAEYVRILFDVGGPAEKAFTATNQRHLENRLQFYRNRLIAEFGTLSMAETADLIGRASEMAHEAVTHPETRRRTNTEKIDRVLLHRFWGPLILVVAMGFMFQSIFSWAEPIMNLMDGIFSALGDWTSSHMADGPVRSLLVDGIIGGVGSVLIFLPQIVILFLFISVLEDSGYMPRVAFLVDRAFSWCGLSGKSFIPLLSSFACAVPGILATRTIENKKQRFITILVSPLMTCSARLPVYAIMIAAFIPYKLYLGIFNLQGIVLGTLYGLGLVVAILVSLVLKKTMQRRQRGTFLMELPSYKVPTLKSVGIRVYQRAKSFVLRAGTVIMAITVIIWALSYYPRHDAAPIPADQMSEHQDQASYEAGEQLRHSYLGKMGQLIEPVFEPLGWDWKITMATLASFPAREVIIATLGTIYNLGEDVDEESSSLVDKMRQARWDAGDKTGQLVYSPAVALSIMVFFALCCQCGATVVTIRQETGSWKYAAGVFAYMTLLAYGAALATYQIFGGVLGI